MIAAIKRLIEDLKRALRICDFCGELAGAYENGQTVSHAWWDPDLDDWYECQGSGNPKQETRE